MPAKNCPPLPASTFSTLLNIHCHDDDDGGDDCGDGGGGGGNGGGDGDADDQMGRQIAQEHWSYLSLPRETELSMQPSKCQGQMNSTSIQT